MKNRIETYISYLSVNRRLSEASLKAYLRDLALYSDFLSREGIQWDGVDNRTARNFLSHLSSLKYSNSGINRSLSAVRGFYRYWVRADQIELNPFDSVQGLKKSGRLPKTMAGRELDGLFSVIPESGFAGTRDRLIFELLYSTGCRVSEAVGINISDFSSGYESLKVRGKGRKERIVFMGKQARMALTDYFPYRAALLNRVGESMNRSAIAETNDGRRGEKKTGAREGIKPQGDPLFLNRRGGRLSVRGVTHILDYYSDKAGLTGRVSPHTFRHTFATDLLNNGANIREVQEMLGHASLSTTQVYTHVGIENAKREYRKAHPHGGGRT
ncbi:MAG: tyrosine-type recombinase/integrase [Spirochaetales bacterium]|nr:tyrosine-type recombinase/integrase [Spirochaetales bacterium]